MDKIKQAIFANPYTTLVAVAAGLTLAVLSKQMNLAQVAQFVLLILLGLGAKDGHKSDVEPN